ncbi:tricarballylate utilization 4Fe-4S protein TcuB [Pseudooceanicola sp.]|uniref:tricarballylate utilization 4Fe-4S protein TcuB n=1 Tax=Pseudooceanicola sp. TaxID=1914328 RepID=UPI002616BB60|nr:tricarballylate utilization 4Fe-4S protein TcuB [Pseudooceanicola sp.]MDF1856594.1 tricarballylate utilization 4Fe-4S protein TcuB [Pseudooceanicola sp.]
MSLDEFQNAPIDEARRQLEICNACRYCEGYCAVFPAMTRQKQFASGDITQLATLCHNCRGCYYACQYTAPHEFDLNLPQALAEVRAESWQALAWPIGFARLFQRSGLAVALAFVVGFALLFWLARALPNGGGEGFYAQLSHNALMAIFLPAFLLPLVAIIVALRRYWALVGGGPIRARHLLSALHDAARMRNLDGGQGQGCNFEVEDRFSGARRSAHQLVMWGFLLCFAATSVATLMHYMMGWHAPYALLTPPKILGVPGGIMLVVGTIWLARLKRRADPELSAKSVASGEMGFVALLFLTGASGLALYAARNTGAMPLLLALHLGAVFSFFLLMPYSKMIHGFVRLAALARDAQDRS